LTPVEVSSMQELAFCSDCRSCQKSAKYIAAGAMAVSADSSTTTMDNHMEWEPPLPFPVLNKW
jgi:hypothetical protein